LNFYNKFPSVYYAKVLISSQIRYFLQSKQHSSLKDILDKIDYSVTDEFDTTHFLYLHTLIEPTGNNIARLTNYSPLSYQALTYNSEEVFKHTPDRPNSNLLKLGLRSREIFNHIKKTNSLEIAQYYADLTEDRNLRINLYDYIYHIQQNNKEYIKSIKTAYTYATSLYGESLKGVDRETLFRMFPTPYKSLVLKYATQYQVPPEMIYAVIREESRFQASIISRANAIGLMQLMPGTGKEVATKLKVKNYSLINPEDNIAFGTYYLKFLERYTDEYPMLLAAYNAGHKKATRWNKSFDNYPPHIKYEIIPYQETRNYIRKVYRSYYIYRYLLNNQRMEM